MEIAQYNFEPEELLSISKAQRRALGGITYFLVRRLGSPDHLELTGDNLQGLARIMSPLLPEPLPDTALPAFEARATVGKQAITARLPGSYQRQFPLVVDMAYLLQEPRFDSSKRNLLAIASVQEARISCWPDRDGKLEWPSPNTLNGDFAVEVAAKALKRLRKAGLPEGTAWQSSYNAVE